MKYTEQIRANFDLFTYLDIVVNLVNFTQCISKQTQQECMILQIYLYVWMILLIRIITIEARL
jgi:hypothetical protein